MVIRNPLFDEREFSNISIPRRNGNPLINYYASSTMPPSHETEGTNSTLNRALVMRRRHQINLGTSEPSIVNCSAQIDPRGPATGLGQALKDTFKGSVNPQKVLPDVLSSNTTNKFKEQLQHPQRLKGLEERRKIASRGKIINGYANKISRRLLLFRGFREGNSNHRLHDETEIPWDEFIFGGPADDGAVAARSRQKFTNRSREDRLQQWNPIQQLIPARNFSFQFSNYFSAFNNNHHFLGQGFDGFEDTKSKHDTPWSHLSSYKITISVLLLFSFWLGILLIKVALTCLSFTSMPWLTGTKLGSPAGLVGNPTGYCITGFQSNIHGNADENPYAILPRCYYYNHYNNDGDMIHREPNLVPRLPSNFFQYFDSHNVVLVKPATLFDRDRVVRHIPMNGNQLQSNSLHLSTKSAVGRYRQNVLDNNELPGSWLKELFPIFKPGTKIISKLGHVNQLSSYIWSIGIILSISMFVCCFIFFLITNHVLPISKCLKRQTALRSKEFVINNQSTYPDNNYSQKSVFDSMKQRPKDTTDKEDINKIYGTYLRDRYNRLFLRLTGTYLAMSGSFIATSCILYGFTWNLGRLNLNYMDRACGRNTGPFRFDRCKLWQGYYMALGCALLDVSLAVYAFTLSNKLTIYRSAMKFKLSKKYLDIKNAMQEFLKRYDDKIETEGAAFNQQFRSLPVNWQMNREITDGHSDERSIYSYLPNHLKNRQSSEL